MAINIHYLTACSQHKQNQNIKRTCKGKCLAVHNWALGLKCHSSVSLLCLGFSVGLRSSKHRGMSFHSLKLDKAHTANHWNTDIIRRKKKKANHNKQQTT